MIPIEFYRILVISISFWGVLASKSLVFLRFLKDLGGPGLKKMVFTRILEISISFGEVVASKSLVFLRFLKDLGGPGLKNMVFTWGLVEFLKVPANRFYMIPIEFYRILKISISF